MYNPKPMTINPLDTKNGERIAKRLSRAGVCSRREAERLIHEGRVRVDGIIIDTPATIVLPDTRILVDDKLIARPSNTTVWIHHKRPGEIVTRNDPQGRRTIFQSLPKDIGYILTIGRLDFNSEGLILLTNDGDLARKLELPETGWTRRYRVRVLGRPNSNTLKSVKNGCTISGIRYGPIKITIETNPSRANSWLSVALNEGKNREVRRVLEHFGLKVNRLIRVSYGPFQLGKLPQGESRKVPDKVIKEQIGAIKNVIDLSDKHNKV
jgi:23S rRNA pseudouridine2605 synthase|tara:strand:+ start:355 stop:1155 length:801 start_codon:yes stop_codon:yes gene_type:complete